MSMNILITATRKITFKKKDGKRSGGVQKIKFDEIQTPTTITRQILASKDLVKAYKDYVATLSHVEKVAVYEKDDLFEEGPVLFYEDFDWTKEHLEKFDQWIEFCDQEGFTVKFEEM